MTMQQKSSGLQKKMPCASITPCVLREVVSGNVRRLSLVGKGNARKESASAILVVTKTSSLIVSTVATAILSQPRESAHMHHEQGILLIMLMMIILSIESTYPHDPMHPTHRKGQPGYLRGGELVCARISKEYAGNERTRSFDSNSLWRRAGVLLSWQRKLGKVW